MTQPMTSDPILDEIELGERVADALARPVSTKQPEELKPALENAASFNTGDAQETAMQNIDFDKLAGLLDSFSSRLTVDRLRSCDPTAAEHAVDAFFDLRDAVCSLRSAAGAQREAADEPVEAAVVLDGICINSGQRCVYPGQCPCFDAKPVEITVEAAAR